MLTSYQYASNRPIDGIDLDGLEYLPFHKSMYRLGYISESREEELGNGTIATLTSERVVVNVISENIPEGIRDGNGGFTKVWGGPVTASGRDYDASLDGPAIFDRSIYYATPPAFNGTAETGTSFKEITTLKGNAVANSNVPSVSGDNVGGLGNALGKNGFGGMIKNYRGADWIQTLNGEQDLRNGFYYATNMVNENIEFGGFPSTLSALQRGQLINFMSDGSLFTDQLDLTIFTLEGVTNALDISNLGIQALNQLGKLQEATKQNVNTLLTKFKELGGDSSRYNSMSEIIKPSDAKK